MVVTTISFAPRTVRLSVASSAVLGLADGSRDASTSFRFDSEVWIQWVLTRRCRGTGAGSRLRRQEPRDRLERESSLVAGENGVLTPEMRVLLHVRLGVTPLPRLVHGDLASLFPLFDDISEE